MISTTTTKVKRNFILQQVALPVASSNLGAAGPSLNAGTPTPLFPTRGSRGIVSLDGQQYVVAPDGQRFLVNILPPDTTAAITVILNWRPKE
jgi:hypothetical protein